MLAVLAKVMVKNGQVERFSKWLEGDAEGSLREEGCLRFDVLRDEKQPNVFWIYEVYRDHAAYAAHQEAPYFKAFFAEAGDTLEGPPEIHTTTTVFPRDSARWAKR